MHRRAFLERALVASASSFVLPGEAESADADLVVTRLGSGLSLISGGGGNVTLFNSPDGVLLVDGGSVEHSARVLKTVRRLTQTSRVYTLFNTHWHWDQTGSNAVLGEAGTRIIAHENTRLWLTTDVESKWEERVYQRLVPKALPNQTFYNTGTLTFGGEQIDYGYLPQAHTDGDIYVYFRNANVIVAGDVVSVGTYPIIDYSTNGWIGGMVDATAALIGLTDIGTKIIPGKGPVQSRADLQAEHDMLLTLKERLSKLLAKGMSAQEMLDAAPTRDFDSTWGDPALFIANSWPGLVQRARELGVSIV